MLPAFNRANPDKRYFRKLENYTVKNKSRAGATWTEAEKVLARAHATSGTPVKACCEELGRPFSGVCQQYQAVDALFRDTYYNWWERIPATNDSPTPETSLGENTMKTIEVKTFIGGSDAAKMSDGAIFKQIATLEADMAKLQAITNKPKKLVAAIAEMQADIDALVKYVDERDDVTDTPAPASPQAAPAKASSPSAA